MPKQSIIQAFIQILFWEFEFYFLLVALAIGSIPSMYFLIQWWPLQLNMQNAPFI
jgi:hypothetical protein